MVRIFCKNTGTFKEFPEGTTLQDIAPQFEFDKPYDILAAKVNNVAEGLRFRVFHNRDVEFFGLPHLHRTQLLQQVAVLSPLQGHKGFVPGKPDDNPPPDLQGLLLLGLQE